MKAANCYSEKTFFKKSYQQQQFASSSYERTQPQVKVLMSTCLRSEFKVQPSPKLNSFPLLHETVYSYKKIQDSSHDPTKPEISSILRPKVENVLKFGQNFRKTVSLMKWCLSSMRRISRPMYILIPVLLSTLRLPQKLDRINENGKTFQDHLQNPSTSQIGIIIKVLLAESIPLLSL